MADYRTGNLSKCHSVITGTVIWLIAVPVMTSKCHDVITGTVTGPITILVIFRSVTISGTILIMIMEELGTHHQTYIA
jgi:hypothetical protein